jgi:penicillin-binding protein 1C
MRNGDRFFGAAFRFGKRHPFVALAVAGSACFALWLAVPPGDLFPADYSRVVYDAKGRLLRATTARDGQLRFPPTADSLPSKYVAAVTTCEDRHFFRHAGVDPLALVKSAAINAREGRRRRGGSTITMQVVRLSRPEKRSYVNKFFECVRAFKLSLHAAKPQVLKLYAAHVPMGGNIVGLEAASWRYFGKPLAGITWSEAALFAVLPNAPSMINVEKQRDRLVVKRNLALRQLLKAGRLDSLSYAGACLEPLPERSSRIPFEAPHFVNTVLTKSKSDIVTTTLDLATQERVEEIVRQQGLVCRAEGIRNIAVLVLRTGTAEVKAYCGSQDFRDTVNQGQVDGITANRSTGSLLKPFLVAKTLDRGPYVMESMLQDVPTFYGSFYPQNASKDYCGLVSMRDMLVQSLNVPAVRLLYWYGVSDFYGDLKTGRLSGLFRSPEGYGLPLIIGGAEGNLWDLTRFFAALGNMGLMREIRLLSGGEPGEQAHDTLRFCSPGAAWLVLEALSQLRRPGSEYYWQFFTGQVPVAWKTGTSYGQKDAWAIGVNREWCIGVWVGNFTGQGNAALGGAQSAGPVLFKLFNSLSDKSKDLWFPRPEYNLKKITVCKASGMSPTPWCPETVSVMQPLGAWQTATCTIHRRLLLNRTTGVIVCSKCWAGVDTVWKTKAIYPPSVKAVLLTKGTRTDALPTHNPSCPVGSSKESIEILYPSSDISIVVPRNLQGEYEKIVFKAVYQRPAGRLFWYLDNRFLAETMGEHTVAVDLAGGSHRLSVQDENGATESVKFQAFRKEKMKR